jgi:hypothetical protein
MGSKGNLSESGRGFERELDREGSGETGLNGGKYGSEGGTGASGPNAEPKSEDV